MRAATADGSCTTATPPGRRALAGRFGRVVGADLSQPMLDVAARLNADRPALTFTRVTSPAGLDAHRGGHDFVLSLIVLQHVTDRAVVRGYLRALASALRPGGVAVVQLPSAVAARIHWHPARVLGRHAPRLLLRGPERYRPYAMSLTALPEAEARAALEHDGARVEHVVDDNRAGSALIASRAYVVVRAP
jgi:SAM-dependent methyltransferase